MDIRKIRAFEEVAWRAIHVIAHILGVESVTVTLKSGAQHTWYAKDGG